MVEEDKQEVAASDEEEDDDEGPPPGFQCIITPQPPPEAENAEAEEEDGPPPGFDCIAPKSFQSPPSSAETTCIERFESSAPLDTTSSKQDDMEDDEDGPPPGWEFNKLVNALPEEPSCTADIKEEGDDDLDEGPPPGWESVFPCQMSQPHTPTMQPPSTVSPNSEMGSKQITPKNENEVPRSESEDTPMLGQSSPAVSPPKLLPSSEQLSAMAESVISTYLDASNKNDEQKNEKRPTSEHHPVSHLQQLPSNPHPFTPVPKSSSSEKAQLVCGTCRKLCLYPQGTKWIRCSGCQEVNFVLEAHEVGQVKCGACAVLLMYPHGAPAVQCSSCRSVTEITAHNRWPPLSVQQAEARRRRRCNRAR